MKSREEIKEEMDRIDKELDDEHTTLAKAIALGHKYEALKWVLKE